MQVTYAALLPSQLDDRFIRPPLFAGYLAAYAKVRRPASDRHDIVSAIDLKRLRTADAVTERILLHSPDVVALTVFVWNHLKVKSLCKEIRRRSPRTKIVLGGPEVAFTTPDAITRFEADWICNGEGEMCFLTLLNAIDANPEFSQSLPGLLHRDDAARQTSPAPMVKNLDEIPSPYKLGLLEFRRDGFVDLETTRGCPYHCRFCLYGKTFDNLRHFSMERIENDIRYVIDNGATTIYLMDPTFNYPRERCRKVCRLLARLNPNRRVEFHTEARAEVMDEALADDFARAGIVSVEIGLQSTSKETLKLMKRGLGTSHFLKGCQLLFDRGIGTEIGTIAGLPGDDANAVRETAKFVIDHGLGELTVHRLQMLPGSDYYKMAKELQLEYDLKPPYYIRNTPSFDSNELTELIQELDASAKRPNRRYYQAVGRNFKALRLREKLAWRRQRELVSIIRKVEKSSAAVVQTHLRRSTSSERERTAVLREFISATSPSIDIANQIRLPAAWQKTLSSSIVEPLDDIAVDGQQAANSQWHREFEIYREVTFALMDGMSLMATSQEGTAIAMGFELLTASGRSANLRMHPDANLYELEPHLSWIPDSWWRLVTDCQGRSIIPTVLNLLHFEAFLLSMMGHGFTTGELRLEEAAHSPCEALASESSWTDDQGETPVVKHNLEQSAASCQPHSEDWPSLVSIGHSRSVELVQ